MLDAALRRAYESTRYVVETPAGEVVLRVGGTSPLAGAFITAWNPQSVRLDAAENAARQQALIAEVGRRGYEYLPGRGEGEDQRWPPEESILIVGIGRTEAIALARAFGQAAIVYAGPGAPAEILWT